MDELEYLERPIRVIGRYALYGRLAAGGMATVHFGRLLGPAGFSRTVAIKRLHPQFAKDPEFVAMFLDEARLAARIQHPNVVATVDVVAMSEELFLVMDYIRGESFSRLLRASRKRGIEVSVPVIASVIVGMLHGLHAAHEANDEQGRPLSVVHRDVSPQNVLVGVDGAARVLDFGVAKASARVQITRDGQMKGKLAYMAPEQLQGRGVDRRTDLFAAGIVFWEALTGRRLFDAEDPADVLHMITTEEIPPPSAVTPAVNRAVDDIVMKALTRDVNARFQTARAFAIAIEDAVPLASAREVGEWVERVAGDTLLNRERAVAEIEATSSVTDMAALEQATQSSVDLHAPSPAEALDHSRAPGIWEEVPTNVIDPARLVMEDAARTRVQVPRPGPVPRFPAVPIDGAPKSWRSPVARPRSEPPRSSPPVGTLRGLAPPKPPTSRPPPLSARLPASRPPSTPPPSLRAGSELPKAPATIFDDENETTALFGPAHRLPAASPAPVFDDENETTSVFEPSAAGKLLGQSSIPQYAVPTRPRNTRPPSLSPAQKAASLRTAAPSVIIQEDTPAALEQRPSSGPSSSVFHWGKEWSAVRKVAVAATAAGILAGLLIVLFGRSAPSPESASSDNEAARAAPAARPEPPASGTTAEPVAAATEAKAEQERQLELTEPPPADSARVKPAETPPSAGRGSARAASRAKVAREPRANPSVSAPSEEDPAPEVEEEGGAELRERSEPAERRGSGREASRGGKAPVEDDELLVNPYSGSPSAEATASAPNAAPTKAPAAAKATSSKTSRDCKKPYYLDADGIRRVKPECL